MTDTAILSTRTSPRRLPTVSELRALAPLALRFGTVGFAGFAVDTTVVYASKAWLGLYGAGLLSYLVAASCNYLLNRHWTFRHRPRVAIGRQWLVFLAATIPGVVFNRGTYAGLIASVALCRHHPILAIMAGSGAGMVVNFVMAHRIVFAEKRVRAVTEQAAG